MHLGYGRRTETSLRPFPIGVRYGLTKTGVWPVETEREPAELLLEAARAAHERGDIAAARRLHLQILELHPRTFEADEAVVYLLKTEARRSAHPVDDPPSPAPAAPKTAQSS